MTVVVPNAIALAGIVDGSSIVASDHRNNYSAVQVGVNGLIAMFTNAPTKGDLIVSAGGGSFDKLAVGANGLAIVADSTQPLGVKWAAPTGIAVYSKYTTLIDVVNTLTETDILQAAGYTVGANVLGASGIMRITLLGDLFNNSGGAINLTLRSYFDGTKQTDAGAISINNANVRSPFRLDFYVANQGGVTNSQEILGTCFYSPTAAAATTGFGGTPSVAQWGGIGGVDTTLAKVFRLTAQFGTANALTELRIRQSTVEIF